jgi:hypothetical protein
VLDRRLPDRRWTSVIRQSGLPAGIVVALVVVTAAAQLEAAGGPVVVLLTVFAVMVSAATAVLAAVSAPLAGSPLLGWVSLLGGYSLVVLPLSRGLLSPAPSPAAGTGAAPDAEVVFAALRLVALLVIALAVLALARGTLRSAHRQRGSWPPGWRPPSRPCPAGRASRAPRPRDPQRALRAGRHRRADPGLRRRAGARPAAGGRGARAGPVADDPAAGRARNRAAAAAAGVTAVEQARDELPPARGRSRCSSSTAARSPPHPRCRSPPSRTHIGSQPRRTVSPRPPNDNGAGTPVRGYGRRRAAPGGYQAMPS